MGKQIVKQPNGKYCIFSSEVDNITHYNMSVQDIIDQWVEDARYDITEKVVEITIKLEKGEMPYRQFTKSYNDVLIKIKSAYSTDQMIETQKLIESEEVVQESGDDKFDEENYEYAKLAFVEQEGREPNMNRTEDSNIVSAIQVGIAYAIINIK